MPLEAGPHQGVHQLAIKLEDRPKTAFVSPFRKFQYNRFPFGLSNAPAVFQRAVELVLVDCVNFTGIYIDDILITVDPRISGPHITGSPLYPAQN